MKGLDNAFLVSIIRIEIAPRPIRRKARAGLSFFEGSSCLLIP